MQTAKTMFVAVMALSSLAFAQGCVAPQGEEEESAAADAVTASSANGTLPAPETLAAWTMWRIGLGSKVGISTPAPALRFKNQEARVGGGNAAVTSLDLDLDGLGARSLNGADPILDAVSKTITSPQLWEHLAKKGIISESAEEIGKKALAAYIKRTARNIIVREAGEAVVKRSWISLVDGPLPIGDVLAVGLLLWDAYEITQLIEEATRPRCDTSFFFKRPYGSHVVEQKAGSELCTSRKHYPCAGSHTHGYSIWEVRRPDGTCMVREDPRSVRCDGALRTFTEARAELTTCSTGGVQISGHWVNKGEAQKKPVIEIDGTGYVDPHGH
jgi:hypothetical protein